MWPLVCTYVVSIAVLFLYERFFILLFTPTAAIDSAACSSLTSLFQKSTSPPIQQFNRIFFIRIMSDNNGEDDMMMLMCTSCGITAEVDDVKLKNCNDCDLVRYCSIKCQKEHRPKHKRACKKRAAELRDELLFKQPDSSHHGDCPICCLPLQLDPKKSTMTGCCSKLICNGCDHANNIREWEERRDPLCPFCRKPTAETAEEFDKQNMKRIEANDPVAMNQWGGDQYDKGDYQSALTYFTRAAELGYVEAHFELSNMYRDGHGVEKDEGKETFHLEEAAIGGLPRARYKLGIGEWNNGKTERAVKHWIIAATQGDDDSINELMDVFREEDGMVSKDDLAAALRAHQDAVDSAKSPQREAAEEEWKLTVSLENYFLQPKNGN